MSSGANGVEHLLSDEHRHRNGRPRWGLITTVTVVFLAILAGMAVFADGAARAAAEDAVEDEIASRLPGGAGPITATIGGFAFLPQLFTGSLSELDVTFSLDGATIPALAGSDDPASVLTISDGILTHDGVVDFLGMQVGYVVSLEPSVEGGMLVLTPTGIEATTEAASVDLSQLVDLDALTIRACAAGLLPKSIELQSVEAVGSQLEFSVRGTDVPTDISQLKVRGSCE